MSTQTLDKPASADKPKGDKPEVDRLVICPKCNAIFHESELLTPPYDEYPRVLYKPHPKEDPKDKAAEPEEPPDTKVVNSEDELKKAEGEGWSKDVPKPKDAKDQPKHEPVKPPEPHKNR